MKKFAIDLFCGLGGWTEGFLAEGYEVIGFDIERHDYGTGGYPGQLVLQDVTTLHGSQFRDATAIVASPPCQAYSYRAMPWKRAKALPPPDNTLFETCFRIQQEANEANKCDFHGSCMDCDGTGNFYRHDEDGDYLPCDECGGYGGTAGLKRYIPLIVENVRGAQKWVGQAKWHSGAFYFWGDVPALMPVFSPVKQGGDWWDEKCRKVSNARFGSKSPERKESSALIAKIPMPLAQHIARTFGEHFLGGY